MTALPTDPTASSDLSARAPARPSSLLCFGYGFSAAALARRLGPQGWRIWGTTRKPEKAGSIAADGTEPLILSETGAAEAVRAALAEASHLLISAGPIAVDAGADADAAVDPTLAAFGPEIAAAAPRMGWIGYLSTTGVYGDRDGAWIDETAERTPSTERGRLRVAAEDAWLSLWRDLGAPVHLFRLAGIYGPGRGPFEKVRRGTARRIVKPGQVFSRIHVEDIAAILEASIARPNPGAAYNVCDDAPAPPEDVIAYAAELLGAPIPPAVPFETAKADMSPMAVSFYAESKRVSNQRVKSELGVSLRHPTYREGLAAVLAAETNEP